MDKNEPKNLTAKQNRKGDKKSIPANRLTQEQLQQLQNIKIRQFFRQQLQKTSSSETKIQLISGHIVQNIMKGQLKVSQLPESLQNLIKPRVQQSFMKITPQQMQMYEKQARRIQHLRLISNINKQLVNKQPDEVIPYILTKDQHQRKVRQIVEEKRLREQRTEELKAMARQKQQKGEQEKTQMKRLQRSHQQQRKRIQIQQKITKQKQQHIDFLSNDIKHRRDLQQVGTRIPMHIKMQKHFKQSIQLPQLEKKKQEYKQLRQFKKSYSVGLINQHQKQCKERYNQRLEQSKMTRQSSLSLQFKITLPQKPERLRTMLIKQIQRNKHKLSQRQSYVQQKIKREDNYLKKLKQQFKPKIDYQKQREIQSRLAKETQHLRKMSPDVDRRKVGLEYLSEVKQMAKKIKQRQADSEIVLSKRYRSEAPLSPLKHSYSQHSYLTINKDNDSLQKIRQNRLLKIINSQEQPSRKFEKLKMQTQKLEQAKQMKLGILKSCFSQIAAKQASNLALNSIKAKINLIQLMKNR